MASPRRISLSNPTLEPTPAPSVKPINNTKPKLRGPSATSSVSSIPAPIHTDGAAFSGPTKSREPPAEPAAQQPQASYFTSLKTFQFPKSAAKIVGGAEAGKEAKDKEEPKEKETKITLPPSSTTHTPAHSLKRTSTPTPPKLNGNGKTKNGKKPDPCEESKAKAKERTKRAVTKVKDLSSRFKRRMKVSAVKMEKGVKKRVLPKGGLKLNVKLDPKELAEVAEAATTGAAGDVAGGAKK